MGRAAGEVVANLPHATVLRAGQPERQRIVEPLQQAYPGRNGFARAADRPAAPGGDEHLQAEELAQDEVAAGVFLLRVVLREMDGAQGGGAGHGSRPSGSGVGSWSRSAICRRGR